MDQVLPVVVVVMDPMGMEDLVVEVVMVTAMATAMVVGVDVESKFFVPDQEVC
jgi:hypothetical protein